MIVRVKRLMRNPEVRFFVRSVIERNFFYLLLNSGRLTQLIALTGQSGAWRKTIIDRSIAYVDTLLPYLISVFPAL